MSSPGTNDHDRHDRSKEWISRVVLGGQIISGIVPCVTAISFIVTFFTEQREYAVPLLVVTVLSVAVFVSIKWLKRGYWFAKKVWWLCNHIEDFEKLLINQETLVDQERLFMVLPMVNDLLKQVPAALSASKDVPRRAWPAFAVHLLMSYLPRLFEKYTKCSVDATFKYLSPANPNVFVVKHGPGVSVERVQSEPSILPREGSIAGKVYDGKQVLIITHVTDESLKKYEISSESWRERTKYIKSVLAVQVRVKNKVRAVLALDSNTPGAFRENEATVELAKLCSTIFAILLEQYELFEKNLSEEERRRPHQISPETSASVLPDND